jgi:ferredoxin-NADP reductase
MLVKIKNKKEIAKGTLLVDFRVLEEKFSFLPGQFVNIELINPPHTDEKGNSRYFSIILPEDKDADFSVAIRTSQSAFKKFLQEAPISTEVKIGEASGDFLLPKNQEKQLVFIAGGIGIAPFISLLRQAKKDKLKNKIILIYSNKDKESAAFLEELEQYAKENQNFKLILTMTQDAAWSGEKRMINSQLIKDYVKDFELALYFIAGPPMMVRSIVAVLSALGVGDQNIKTDYLAGY